MSQVIPRKDPPNRVPARRLDRIRRTGGKDPAPPVGGSKASHTKDAGVQTCHDKFTQTNSLNARNSFKRFLKDLRETVFVRDGRPCFHSKQISLLASKYFYIDVDVNFILQSLRK